VDLRAAGAVEHLDDPDQGHAALFLLGIEDIVYWARELGGSRTSAYQYPHPDWRFWYFFGLLVFYLAFTRVSEIVLSRITARLSHGQATAAGEEMRKAAA
jgi:polar amino acid transport system permease protein